MLTAMFLTLAAGFADPPKDPPKEPAAKLELFAGEGWYKDQKGKEEEFVGVLEKVKGEVGFGRMNPYRLVMGDGDKKTVRDVYVGGKPELLAGYVGKKIKLIGKPVDMELEGKVTKEIWPARLELVPEKKEDKKDESKKSKADDKEAKITASSYWRSGSEKPQTQVIRSAEEAVIALGMPAEKAKEEAAQKEATEQLAKQFKVEKIDWTTQMVVVAAAGRRNTGGYSVEFTGLEVKDKTMTVKWKVHSPKPGGIVTQAITHPAAAALVERFEGEVKFDPAPPKAEDKDK